MPTDHHIHDPDGDGGYCVDAPRCICDDPSALPKWERTTCANCGRVWSHNHDCQWDGEDEHCIDWWRLENDDG